MARVEPIPPRQWPPEMRPALAAMIPPAPRHPRAQTEGRPKGLNILGTFAHHPELAQAFFTFNGHLLLATTLTMRQRELVVLRVANLRVCSYEWAQHVIVGRDIGMSDLEIAQVGIGPTAPGWSPEERALLQIVDELIDLRTLSDAGWEAAAAILDTRQVMDLIFTVGCYDLLALMMETFQMEFDSELLTFFPTAPAAPGPPVEGIERAGYSSGAR